mmetsp:Transcript_18527/g.57469  ORF Transcript_18527/g.57469 Transcript_18527/m.57469 type:complete len:234 (+) Transcript_18527:521-1222(+)
MEMGECAAAGEKHTASPPSSAWGMSASSASAASTSSLPLKLATAVSTLLSTSSSDGSSYVFSSSGSAFATSAAVRVGGVGARSSDTPASSAEDASSGASSICAVPDFRTTRDTMNRPAATAAHPTTTAPTTMPAVAPLDAPPSLPPSFSSTAESPPCGAMPTVSAVATAAMAKDDWLAPCDSALAAKLSRSSASLSEELMVAVTPTLPLASGVATMLRTEATGTAKSAARRAA